MNRSTISNSPSDDQSNIHQSSSVTPPRFAGSSKLIINTCANCQASEAGGTWRRDPLTNDNLCNSCGLKLQRKRRRESNPTPPSSKVAKIQPLSPSDSSPVSRQILGLQLYLLLGSMIAAQNKAKASSAPSSSQPSEMDPSSSATPPDPFAQPSSAACAVNPNEEVAQWLEESEIEVKKDSLMLSSSSYGSLFDLLLSKSVHLD